MSEELSDLQKLIRLKRYEQPPEGYFDDFLIEFQRRQRAEMLARPAWQIAWERANLWLESFRVPAVAYASILVAALGVGGLIVNTQSGVPAAAGPAIASAAPVAGAPSVSVPSAAPQTGSDVRFSSSANLPPSYILEKRPVTQSEPFSF